MTISGDVTREQLAAAYREFCIKYEYDQSGTPTTNKKHFANCTEVMVRLSQEYQKYRCKKCTNLDFTRKFGSALGRCTVCKKEQVVTGNVQFFHRVKAPSERLFFFEAMRQGIPFNAKQFSDTVGKSSNVGSELFKKINQSSWQNLKKQKRLANAPMKEFMQIFTCRRIIEPWARTEKSILRYYKQNEANPYYKCMLDLHQLLSKEPTSFEVLLDKLQAPIGRVLGAIGELEMRGLAVIHYGHDISKA